MKILLIVLLSLCMASCVHTEYVVLGYDRPDLYEYEYGIEHYKEIKIDTNTIVYLLQRTKFPKILRRVYTNSICGCMNTNDTIFFTREKDTLIINKINEQITKKTQR